MPLADLRAPLIIAIAAAGCDSYVSVTGALPIDATCELSLWTTTRPNWGEPKPSKLASRKINGEFDVTVTLGPPPLPVWVEIACPAREAFRSREFESLHGAEFSLGTVPLVPPRTAPGGATPK